MIDYIVYGEFDINEGNVIKVEYPHKTGINETILSSYLIPEGTHNFTNDCFCFILNRQSNNDEILISQIKKRSEILSAQSVTYQNFSSSQIYNEKVKSHSFLLKEIYTYNSFSAKWESLSLNKTGDKILFKIEKKENEFFYSIVIFKDKEDVFFSIPVHNDIQFNKLNSNFASIYTLNFQALGFEFMNEADLNLLELVFHNETARRLLDSADVEESQTNSEMYDSDSLLNSEKEIYFICYLETRLDKSTKRGAILKSISFGTSSLVNLYIFKPVLKLVLDEIFKINSFNIKEDEKLNLIKKQIEMCFTSVNSLPPKLFGKKTLSMYEREINSFLQSSNYFSTSEKFTEVSINNQKIKLEFNLPNNEEKVFPGNVINFLKTFKESTMTIYDAILTGKKILFVGDANTSCEKLANYIFSTISLCSLFGLIKRIHPYKNLYDLEFLKSSTYIFGVTNPIFKNKTDTWDLMCEIDSGKVTVSEQYKKHLNSINRESDTFFIKEVLYKINNEFLSEYEVEKYFRLYTSHLFRITGEDYFTDDEELVNEINLQYKRKLKLQVSALWKFECELDKVRESLSSNGRSTKLLLTHINNLNSRKNIEKEECMLIYTDIYNFVKGGEFYVTIFLGMLLVQTVDYALLFNGLFSKYDEVASIVKNIHTLVYDNQYGKQLLKKANYMFILKANEMDTILGE